MQPYENLAQDSGVTAYEIGPDYIIVRFQDGNEYIYNDASTGAPTIEQMKRLALQGQGLSTFIAQHVKSNYVAKRG